MLTTLAVLGAGGDLTGRYLLPALVRLAAADELPAAIRIVGVDRAPGDDTSFRAEARERLDRHLPDRDTRRCEEVLERLCYRQADVTSPDDLDAALGDLPAPLAVYLALPNAVFSGAVDALTRIGLPERTTLVCEKPFGTGLADARQLNEAIRRGFGEQDVFRIDHFLAKQTVLNVLGLRFANRVFEPVWNSGHIERVDIVWDESLGLEGRAGYYDRAGALRDMIQNHLLQLLALVAMEPPTSLSERDLRDRKCDVLRAVTVPQPHEMNTKTRRARYTAGRVGGQDLPAYVDEEGVDPSRGTETYAEVTLQVQNWRWAGVPFHLRTGKALAGERREITVHFRPVPHHPFDDRGTPDLLRFTLEPDRIAIEINLNGAGEPFELERATLAARFAEQQLPPYSLLLREIMERDPTLSIRGDEAEESWRIVEPILAAWAADEVPLGEYPAGSAGPAC
ncbi:glucose-6-phosphate dehydrogenase [Pseudonocardia sp. H11422]|uniref:glucose-6-phosphate dehydrogenase n=1 Tax=Pseudonocardia sp. H11422 TaxID=2835866 RepID=UPI001BDC4A85|nr:glucose-6-phosphate dehydrogenase [Pseudonocardia sp. H11422]